jgi:peptidoglycan/LPS O-acetylase OafA/YrhL
MGQLAALGVMMFFVLGGFLITGLLSKEFLASGTIGLKQFYLRRALRIFLAFFLFIAGMPLLIKAGYVTDVP